MKNILSILLLLCSTALACDFPTTDYTFAPGQTHTQTWDFTDCNVGVNGFEIVAVTQPNNKGVRKDLPSNTPLSFEAVNLTTGEIAQHVGGNPFVIQFSANSCGGVIELTMVYSSSAHKPLDVEVITAQNVGGPCP